MAKSAEQLKTFDRISAEERLALRREYAEAIISAPEVAARLPITDHPLLKRCGELQWC